MTVSCAHANSDDQVPLLCGASGGNEPKKRTPLPKVQICVLLLSVLIEPIAAQSIYPFINQVSLCCRARVPCSLHLIQLVRELDIIGGDETKVGGYHSLPHC